MIKLKSRRSRKHLQPAAETDPILREEIGQLFSPPLLWVFKNQERMQREFAQIVASSAQRIIEQNPAQPSTITAAVSRLAMDGVSWRSHKFGDRAWQADAWRLYDITGQLRYVSNWCGNSVSRCDLYVAEVLPDGTAGPRVEDQDIAELAAGPLGIGDDKAEALRLLAIDLFVAGEAYIVAESGGGEDGQDLWWVVTSRQIRRQGDKITVVRSPLHGGGILEYRDGIDLILRVWTPHPADTSEPDSPTRSAIPDLREMEALRRREFAELDSRVAGAGLLAIPQSMELPRGDDDPVGVSGFSALLGRTMARSLRDRSSADAMVPIILTGPAEDIGKIKHLTFWSELSAQIGDMREGALRSLAQSLDIPPEVLLGLGSSTNHWNAWAISREAVQVHIKPILSRIAAALTTGYLTPALEVLGKEAKRYMYVFDTSPLTTNPDRSTDALNLHDRMLLSDDAARFAASWNDTDAPSPDERSLRLLEKLLLSSPAEVLSDPALRRMINLPPADTSTAPPGSAVPPVAGTPQPTPVEETEKPPTEPDRNQPAEEPVTSARRASSGLSFAAQIAAKRALSLAGARLVPHSKRPTGVARYQLHVQHGPVAGNRKIDVFLDGSWRAEFDGIGEEFGIDDQAFFRVVEEHCQDLLARGIAYDGQLVADLFASPVTLRRLVRHE